MESFCQERTRSLNGVQMSVMLFEQTLENDHTHYEIFLSCLNLDFGTLRGEKGKKRRRAAGNEIDGRDPPQALEGAKFS